MNKFGRTRYNPVEGRLRQACAIWTDEGWIVKGNLNLSGLELTELPLIKSVDGYFDCSDNELTSLKGAPKEVGGDFYCGYNELTSLEGAPKSIDGDFSCSNNQLTSLEGAPKEVGGNFYCYNNKLTSLEGAPKEVGGVFYCGDNPGNFTKEDILAVCDVKDSIER